jgi:hypothetical protein
MHGLLTILALEFSDEVSIGNVVTLVTLLAAVVAAFYSLRETTKTTRILVDILTRRLDGCNIEQIRERVDTMWIFQLRRGLTETETKGLGKTNSPMKLTQEAYDVMKPLQAELKAFYDSVGGEKVGIVDLAVMFEQQFGERLSREVCKKVGISDASCLVLAIGMVRPIGFKILREASELCREESIHMHSIADLIVHKGPKAGRK